jgi:hypothetical protein
MPEAFGKQLVCRVPVFELTANVLAHGKLPFSRSDPSYSLDAQLCVHLQTYFEQLKELGVHHCLLLHKKECYYFFSLDLKLC